MADRPDPANFVRRLVLRKPDIELAEVQKEWDKASLPRNRRPDMMAIHQARYAIKQKFDIDDLSKIPFKSPGVLDVVALLRLMLRKKKDLTFKQAQHFLRSDGVAVTDQDWNAAKGGALVPVQPQPAAVVVVPPAEESPDENQHTGPRARHVGTKGRKPGSGKRAAASRAELTAAKEGLGDKYLQMEEQLDDLVQAAREVQNPELVTVLRDARRAVIIKGHQLTKK